MKIVSFNVNSLRQRLHQLQAVIDKHDPAFIGLQETKVQDTEFPLGMVEELGYQLVLGDVYPSDPRRPGVERIVHVSITNPSLDSPLEYFRGKAELERALQTPAPLIGINNRNLQTFTTDLATTERLLPWIPDDHFVVTESGITCRADVVRLQQAGARGFLVGESLMREDDIGAKLRELQGQTD